jgi:hypothetical protein
MLDAASGWRLTSSRNDVQTSELAADLPEERAPLRRSRKKRLATVVGGAEDFLASSLGQPHVWRSTLAEQVRSSPAHPPRQRRPNQQQRRIATTMGFALVLRELLRRRGLLVLGVGVALFAAILSVYRVGGFGLEARSLQYSSASAEVLVDSSSSAFGDAAQPIEPLASRAAVYASFMTNPSILNLIGRQVGLSGNQLYATGPALGATRTEQEPTALKRNLQITGETKPYRLEFEAHETLPTITVNVQAPTTHLALALASAATVALREYVAHTEIAENIPPSAHVVVRQLGPAHGAVVNGGISKELAAMVFVAVFLLWCVLILVGARFRQTWRESAAVEATRQRGASGAGDQTEGVDEAPGADGRSLDRPDSEPIRAKAELGGSRFGAPVAEHALSGPGAQSAR